MSMKGKDLLSDLEFKVTNVAWAGTTNNRQTIDIIFGNAPQSDQQDVLPKNYWSTTYDPGGSPYVVTAVDSLSKIAEREYGKDKFFVPDSKLSIANYRRGHPDGVELYYFFPLIILATYKRMQTDKSYFVDVRNPDNIQDGRNLCIPPITLDKANSLIGNAQVAEVFKLYGEYFVNTNRESWSKAFEDIYVYLKYGSR